MPPSLAAVLCTATVAALFALERSRSTAVSSALWLPFVWFGLGASRNVSQWLGVAPTSGTPNQYLDGSPLDRNIFLALLIAALVTLARRSHRLRAVVTRNPALIAFVIFAALSSLWSDFPGVALKRWTKMLGNVAMAWIVVTEEEPAAGMRALYARVSFVLLPYSVLFIKYFSDIGREYDRWLGTPYYTGVTTGKNSLGAICFLLGLASAASLLTEIEERPFRRGPAFAHAVMVGAALWLLGMAESATSNACFGIGLVLLVALRRRSVSWAYATIATLLLGGVLAYSLLDGYGAVVGALGRDETLTGRTDLWEEVLRMVENPLLGAGFETFFLGARAEYLWSIYWWRPNQAHNGYIELYLTLGIVGLVFFAGVVVSALLNALEHFKEGNRDASLLLALLVVALLYNLTEAAFKVMHPVWISFLLIATARPPTHSVGHRTIGRRHRKGRSPGVVGRDAARKASPDSRSTSWSGPWPAARLQKAGARAMFLTNCRLRVQNSGPSSPV